MPYNKNSDLPQDLKDLLPKHAEDIYKEAFNSAYAQYKDKKSRKGDRSREETAHAVAWGAVKQKYKKDTKTGKWILKTKEE